MRGRADRNALVDWNHLDANRTDLASGMPARRPTVPANCSPVPRTQATYGRAVKARNVVGRANERPAIGENLAVAGGRCVPVGDHSPSVPSNRLSSGLCCAGSSRAVVETAHSALENCSQVFRYAVATGRVKAIRPAISRTLYASRW